MAIGYIMELRVYVGCKRERSIACVSPMSDYSVTTYNYKTYNSNISSFLNIILDLFNLFIENI